MSPEWTSSMLETLSYIELRRLRKLAEKEAKESAKERKERELDASLSEKAAEIK
jgi:hypothetical protein